MMSFARPSFAITPDQYLSVILARESVDTGLLSPSPAVQAIHHSLYIRRTGSWPKTNVVTHINHVEAAGMQNEMRILKLWRDQKRLDFPSFFLELIVIEALPWHTAGTLSDNVFRALQYIKAKIA